MIKYKNDINIIYSIITKIQENELYRCTFYVQSDDLSCQMNMMSISLLKFFTEAPKNFKRKT